MSATFPASAGPWLNVTFDNPRAAARFAKGVREVTGYRAAVDDANPRRVVTNIERWQVAEVMNRQRTLSRNAPLYIDSRPSSDEGTRDMETPPSSRRGAKRGYRFEVASALIRNHRISPERAFRLVEKWGGLVDLRMGERRSPLSTAEHVDRFERQGIVSPFAGRDARARRFRRCTRGMEVQTLIFPDGFGERRAKRWAKGHDYRFGKVDVSRTTGSIRLRQRSPDDFVEDSFRTITVDERAGVQAVVGCPKRGREGDVSKRRA